MSRDWGEFEVRVSERVAKRTKDKRSATSTTDATRIVFVLAGARGLRHHHRSSTRFRDDSRNENAFQASQRVKISVPSLRSNGISVYYEIHGEGERILLVGGLSIDLTALEGLTSELSQTFRVIAFDNRGAGRSDKPDAPYTVEMMAEDTAGLVETLAGGPINVVGISLGGRIAMALTLQHPELVKSLVLLSTSARVPRSMGRSLLLAMLEVPRRLGPSQEVSSAELRVFASAQGVANLRRDLEIG